MSPELLSALTVFVLAILVGFAVISKVPATPIPRMRTLAGFAVPAAVVSNGK